MHRPETVHRRRLSIAPLAAALFALGWTGVAGPAGAAEEGLRLTFSDDLVSGSERPDDLYTAELRLESHAGGFVFRLGERMFTRRELGRRFDETFGDLSLGPLALGDWQVTPRLGALRVGEGVLGERAQNEIHGWVGSERVELDYVEGRRWYPTFEAAAQRSWSLAGGAASLSLDGFAAPDFRQHLRADVTIERPLGEAWSVRFGGGYRFDRVEHELLVGALRDSGPTAELGIAWRSIGLRWSYNDFGTRAGALTVAVDIGALRRPAGGR